MSNLVSEKTEPDFLYFGCWGSSAGHWLRDEHGQQIRYDHKAGRWPIINSAKIDGSFTPKSTRKHGAAKLWHTITWTILALHDYSRDKRPASNAAFILRGDHTAEEVLAAARNPRSPFSQQLAHIEKMGPINVVEQWPHE
jgi:hypothetical protein